MPHRRFSASAFPRDLTGTPLFSSRKVIMNNNDKLPLTLKHRQFCIVPISTMPINKAQGQNLDRVGIYLQTLVFSHGQLYVDECVILVNNLYSATGDGQMPLIDGATTTCTKSIAREEMVDPLPRVMLSSGPHSISARSTREYALTV